MAETKVEAERQAPPAVPRHGHSKDHRPTLKQLLLSVLVNGDGVIYQGSVDAGNASDKTLNRRVIADLFEAFSPETLADLVYVANSSLVTAPNLAVLRQKGLALISWCSGTFSATRAAQALSKQTFHCAHDAEVAAQSFQAQAEYRWFPQSPVRIASRLERVSTSRGRPCETLTDVGCRARIGAKQKDGVH